MPTRGEVNFFHGRGSMHWSISMANFNGRPFGIEANVGNGLCPPRPLSPARAMNSTEVDLERISLKVKLSLLL